MGKRSNFKKKGRDLYPTPEEAVQPLLKFLRRGSTFVEPCAADGLLVKHLVRGHGMKCRFAADIKPLKRVKLPGLHIATLNGLNLARKHVKGAKYIITNPPWSRDKKSGYLLHRLIEVFMALRPTWLLFDADWAHTKQAAPYMDQCVMIVAIGRVKWFPKSKHTGKENCCWYLFDKNHSGGPKFIGREA